MNPGPGAARPTPTHTGLNPSPCTPVRTKSHERAVECHESPGATPGTCTDSGSEGPAAVRTPRLSGDLLLSVRGSSSLEPRRVGEDAREAPARCLGTVSGPQAPVVTRARSQHRGWPLDARPGLGPYEKTPRRISWPSSMLVTSLCVRPRTGNAVTNPLKPSEASLQQPRPWVSPLTATFPPRSPQSAGRHRGPRSAGRCPHVTRGRLDCFSCPWAQWSRLHQTHTVTAWCAGRATRACPPQARSTPRRVDVRLLSVPDVGGRTTKFTNAS